MDRSTTPHVPVTLADLHVLVERIYGPEGCLWARQQTHATLSQYVLEEAEEVVEVLHEEGLIPSPEVWYQTSALQPARHLCEELGDLLYQVLVHTTLAERERLFTLGEVLAGLHAKLLRRHPHVFAGRPATTLAEVDAIWAEVKAREQETERSQR